MSAFMMPTTLSENVMLGVVMSPLVKAGV